MSTRAPAVAGQFYPRKREELLAELERCIPADVEATQAIGIIAPHAGYLYSGRTAGVTYAQVVVPDRVVVLSPNHTGRGEALSLWARGSWSTPLGEMPVDETLTARLLEEYPAIKADEMAHLSEHSLEVQLPFIQKLNPNAEIVPLTLGTHHPETLQQLGAALARLIKNCAQKVLLVASSDMTHFESAQSAKLQDEKALERIAALDPAGLLAVVQRERITMCGAAPVATVLWAAKGLDAAECSLVEYTHSGQVSGDDSSVVSYAGMVCR